MRKDTAFKAAVVTDAQGAMVGLLKTSGGDPADLEQIHGNWLWTELLTTSADSANSFYESLMDYESNSLEVREGFTYYVLSKENKPRAGIGQTPWEGVKPNWLPYILVDDPKNYIDKVKKLGGNVVARLFSLYF